MMWYKAGRLALIVIVLAVVVGSLQARSVAAGNGYHISTGTSPNQNNAPVATNDAYSTAEDTPLNITAPGVLANDTDADVGDALRAVLVSGPTAAQGSLALNPDGSFVFTPAPNFNGTATFTYQAQDPSNAVSNVATVTITVNAVDDAPTAVADSATVAEDSVATAIDVLANDTDIDGGPKVVASVTQPANGTVTFTPTGVTYTPNANYNGPDSFTYTLNGGSTATVTVTVTAVDDAPTPSPTATRTPTPSPTATRSSAGPPSPPCSRARRRRARSRPP